MTLPPVGSWGAVGASERAKQLMQQSRSIFFVRSWTVFDGERFQRPLGRGLSTSRARSGSGAADFHWGCAGAGSARMRLLLAHPGDAVTALVHLGQVLISVQRTQNGVAFLGRGIAIKN